MKILPRHQSSAASLNSLMIYLGALIGNSLGLVVPLQYFSLPFCLPSLILLPLCWLLVESPIWLIRRNKKVQAVEVLRILRGENYVLDEEVEEMQSIVKTEATSRLSLSAFKSRTFLLPALLIVLSYFVDVTSGVELCSYYVGFIFKSVRLETAAIITQVGWEKLSRQQTLLCSCKHLQLKQEQEL